MASAQSAGLEVNGSPGDSVGYDGSRREQLRSRNFYEGILDALGTHVAVIESDGTISAVNGPWLRFARENGAPHLGVGDNYLSVCDAAAATMPEVAATVAALRQILTGKRGSYESEYPCHAPFEERWFSLRATAHRSEGPARVVVEHANITDRVLAERDSQFRNGLLDSISVAVVATDLYGAVTAWSDGAHTLFGWTEDEVFGEFALDLIVPEEAREREPEFLVGIRGDGRWQGDVEMVRKDGSRLIAATRVSVTRNDDGGASGFVSVSTDVTERVEALRSLGRARNRLSAVTECMGEGLVGVDEDGAVVYMNSAAEQLLRWPREELLGRDFHAATHRLDPEVSEDPIADCPVERARRDGSIVRVDEDLMFRRDGTTVWVSYTVAPFESEQTSRGSVIVLQDVTEQRAENARLHAEVESLSMSVEVRDALEEERLELFAQPIVDLSSGETVQHELLIRMRSEDGTLVPPLEFLGVAERFGYMRRIDRWVVEQAADLLAAGHSVEINLSASSLGDDELLGRFERALSRPGIEPNRLVIEITETALMEDEPTATAFLHGFAALGCRVALDDFGTGYGGFTYLKNLPVHYLKVDREFIRDIVTNEASLHVTKAVVGLAHAFGQQVVAEGVEDAETAELLRGLGVELAQGFSLGRPAPVREIFPT